MNQQVSNVVGRPFRPGQSGNPGGRPKSNEHVRNIARSNSVRAVERLIELIESDDERVALTAAKEVLDRAFGKPKPDVADDKEQLSIRIVQFSENRAGEIEAEPKGDPS